MYACLHSVNESDIKHITCANSPHEALSKFLKSEKIQLPDLIKTRYVKPISYLNTTIDYQKKTIQFHKKVITFDELIKLMCDSEYINETDAHYSYCAPKHLFQEVDFIQ